MVSVLRPAPYVGAFDIHNIRNDRVLDAEGRLVRFRTLEDELDRTRLPGSYSRVNNGFEISSQARLPGGGTLIGGWTADKETIDDCQDERNRADNPNNLRFCDSGAFPRYFRHELKIAGTLPFSLPRVGAFNAGFALLGIPGTGLEEEFRYSRSSSTNVETTYGRNGSSGGPKPAAPFHTAATCVAPCVLGARILGDRATNPTVSTSTSRFTAVILPDDSVKFRPRLTQVDFNLAKVFNILGWRYDARFEIFNLLNNDAERSHDTERGTSVALQTSTFERAENIIDARVYRFAVTARF